VLYREGMSGLILLSALCAVVYFVVVVKFATSFVLGIPLGQFSVFCGVAVVFVIMAFTYCKDFILGRNLALGYLGSAIIVAVLAAFGIEVNGYVYFFTIFGAGVIYAIFEMLRHRLQKCLVAIGFVLASLMFVFSVNYVFNNVLGAHQQSRIKETLGIEENLRGAGYNVNQSKIAIGSGGVLGKGFLHGTQTKLKYVPEQHTDFIFCTVGEEEGFLGTTALVSLFLFLILRLIYIAERQTSVFGRVYAYSVVSYFIFHLCINVGMVIGLCPVIGIPLPFFSYGGSALWGFTILLFVLLRIDAAR
jgi:rod shape determining protein RodA